MGRACGATIEQYHKEVCGNAEKLNTQSNEEDSAVTVDMQKKGHHRRPNHARSSSNIVNVRAKQEINSITAPMQTPKSPTKMQGVPVEIGSEKTYENMFSYFKQIDDLNINWMYEKNPENSNNITNTWVNVNPTITMDNT